jgi:hypothetical protein
MSHHTNRKTITLPEITPPIAPASPPGLLLSPEQLAERLNVPVSWIRERVRTRARVRDADPIPVVKLGKYCRFFWPDVEAWVRRQTEGATK